MEAGHFTIVCKKETQTQEFVLREFEIHNNEEVMKHFIFLMFPSGQNRQRSVCFEIS